jgi:hypothetical protein
MSLPPITPSNKLAQNLMEFTKKKKKKNYRADLTRFLVDLTIFTVVS